MDQTRINYLLTQYGSGTITAAELKELETIFSVSDREELMAHISTLIEGESRNATGHEPIPSEHIFQQITASDKPGKTNIAPVRAIRRRWMYAAAVLLALIATGAYFFFNQSEKSPQLAQTATKPEKDPGRNTAILTLADGSTMELDSAGNGIIAVQGNANVRLQNGLLAYDAQRSAKEAVVAYNTITTPRGGEFAITLPDGSKVWLNAASSLRFPTAFTGDKRVVELTGEAYLQVAEDKAHPFEVKIRDIQVSVLGTQFNIMGYDDEPTLVTTLVSGSVKVETPGKHPQLLVPGEHAVLNHTNGSLSAEKADIVEETAWKNGQIHFNGANIRQIMRQVSRWYDTDIVFKGNVADLDFTCTVSRKDKLSKLLGLLELTGAVHFTMENGKIIVQP
ncbi:FecR family protein [Parasegetibacter sp. NRK P23]|uniref:FecR family protein n=1 Tax=Parasegetibacter sp. NRK P23 TaxID=2942999 RepID=UPI00204365B1|nr:FecR family protein [Parasegetibacter sp. NRK P23]MCM5527715.1 FecR domain-containing protein [Parasegetibacter sp. NRK P23]